MDRARSTRRSIVRFNLGSGIFALLVLLTIQGPVAPAIALLFFGLINLYRDRRGTSFLCSNGYRLMRISGMAFGLMGCLGIVLGMNELLKPGLNLEILQQVIHAVRLAVLAVGLGLVNVWLFSHLLQRRTEKHLQELQAKALSLAMATGLQQMMGGGVLIIERLSPSDN